MNTQDNEMSLIIRRAENAGISPGTIEALKNIAAQFAAQWTAFEKELSAYGITFQQFAATLSLINDRMAAIEKQIRLNTLVTPTQVRFLNSAIRARARELLLKRGAEDCGKAGLYLSNRIRKAVMMRYGVSALYEIPKHEYPVALSQINTWNDALCVRDVLKRCE